MRRTVRQGCFETNSSSLHTLIVARGNRQVPDYMTMGTVFVTGGEYGWEVSVLRSPEDRLSYLYTALSDEPEGLKQVEDALASVGVKVKWDVTDRGYYPRGYIDHSACLKPFLDFLQESPDNILDFVFDTNSAVATGNDNDEDEYPADVEPEKVDYVEFFKRN